MTVPWNNQLQSLVIVTAPAGQYAGIFVYSPAPGLGNLIGSWAAQAGTDPFGNTYPQGLNVKVGSISGVTITGTNFILNPSGFFFYSSTPAANNLIGSIANTAGTDGFGNAYLQGQNAYFQGVSQWTAIGFESVTGGAQLAWWYTIGLTETGWIAGGSISFAGGVSSPAGTPLAYQANGQGLLIGTTFIEQVSGNYNLQMPGQNTPPNKSGFLAMAPDSTATNLVVVNSANQGLFAKTGTSDHTSHTVTAATQQQLCAQYSIPAGDMQAGTTYRLTFWGQGTQGSTQQQANFFPILGGTTFCNTDIGSAIVPASGAFHFFGFVEIICTASGAGGTVTAGSLISMGASAVAVATNQMTAPGNAQSFSINTTAVNTLSCNFQWNAITGSPTITCFGSTIERGGP